MSFNTEPCANSAGLLRKLAKSVCNFSAHSILIGGFPFIPPDASWPVGGFATLKAKKSPGLGLSEAGCPHNYTLHVTVCPFAFCKGWTSQYNSKGQRAENSLGHRAAILSRCLSSEHCFSLNHQHPGLRVSCSLDSSLS